MNEDLVHGGIYMFLNLSAGELIPPKASLTFEVELLDIKDGVPPQNVFKEIDADEDNKLSQEEVGAFKCCWCIWAKHGACAMVHMCQPTGRLFILHSKGWND